jgi:hypothetical protein
LIVVEPAKFPELVPGEYLVPAQTEQPEADAVLGAEPGIVLDTAIEAVDCSATGFAGRRPRKGAEDYLPG